MDVLIRCTIAVILGAAFAIGPGWSHLGLLLLYPLAAGRGLCTIAIVSAFYTVALLPAAMAAIDYSATHIDVVLAYTAPLMVNVACVGLALTRPARSRVIAVPLVVIVLALPPLASVSLISPASLAGYLFPGSGHWGLLLLGISIAWVSVIQSIGLVTRRRLIVLLAAAPILFNSAAAAWPNRSPHTMDIVGVNTQRGMPDAATTALFRTLWQFEASEFASIQRVSTVLFPESHYGDWHSSDAQWLIDHSKRFIGGARIPVSQHEYINALIDGASGQVLYRQRAPIALQFGHQRQAIPGTNASAHISALLCIEAANPWLAARTFASAPTGVLWAANLGWSNNPYLHQRMLVQLAQWSALYDTPFVSAVNTRKVLS